MKHIGHINEWNGLPKKMGQSFIFRFGSSQ